MTQVGYGVNDTGNAGVLFEVRNRTSVSCNNAGGSDANLICFSQQDGKGTCSGDSGGPSFAMIDGVQTIVGITSYGDQNCQFFGAMTRVDAEIAYADSNIGGALKCVHDGVCNTQCGGGSLPADEDCPTCATASDCGDDQICGDNSVCAPAPFADGGTGFECVAGAQCFSGSCVDGPGDGSNRCTEACTAGDDGTCPDGFDCLETTGADGACWPSEPTGCCSSGRDDAMTSAVFGAIGMLGFAFAGRRRRRFATASR